MPAGFDNKTEFGHPVPPGGPHAVTIHFPGWSTAKRFRDGDMTIFSQLKGMYPRFMPWGPCRQLCGEIHKKLSLPATHACLVWPSPDTAELVRAYALSPFRGKDRLEDEAELIFKVVDISRRPSAGNVNGASANGGPDPAPIRLFVVAVPASKLKAVAAAWQIAGTGASTRLAEALLPHVETGLVEVEGAVPLTTANSTTTVPAPSAGLPQGPAHEALRRRIAGLLRRAPVDPARAALVRPGGEDVFLYPSGMAAIYRAHKCLVELRPGTVLGLGSLFKSTWQLLEEHPGGMKHIGDCSARGDLVARAEEWLRAEAEGGRPVSYCFVEFPSNPILVSADLFGLRRLADKYGFPLVVDDTVGSFANIDLLPVADVVISSLTKTFSGYADVMAGSAVLNPTYHPASSPLATIFASRFRNEFFEGDADRLLANNEDYLTRTSVLNRNAAAVAARLAALVPPSGLSNGADSHNPLVIGVNYPPHTDTRANFAALMRPGHPDFTPGHGCLLSIDFATIEQAVAFYDNCAFFSGPHLGAHRTLVVPFSELVWGGPEKEKTAYHAAYGLRPPQVRLSVGLEEEAELLAALDDALEKARIVPLADEKGN